MSSTLASRTLAVALLVGFAIHQYAMMDKPARVAEYHQRIRAAAQSVPAHIGSWVGEVIPIPTRVQTVLQPNVILSRRYTNVETGCCADLLLVQCTEAHSMAGHFPLRCYPAEGWSVQSATPRDWAVGNLSFTGTEYEFTIDEIGQTRSLIVANCLLLPGGKVLRDMNAMAKALAGRIGQSAGAGQIQICFDASIPEAQRDQAITELLGGYQSVLAAILAKVPR